MKIRALGITFLMFVFAVFVGCSKDDVGGSTNTKEALKVTVTSSSTFTNDNSQMTVSVGATDAKGNAMKWVVNGANGVDGQVLYILNSEYFYGGKTAVLQSQPNYTNASITISGFSMTVPYTITYKVEQGNKVITEKTQSIQPSATAFSVNLSY